MKKNDHSFCIFLHLPDQPVDTFDKYLKETVFDNKEMENVVVDIFL